MREIRHCSLFLSLALLLGAALAPTQGAEPKSPRLPKSPAPVFPLSDPQNKGGWKPCEVMTDEFEGTTLDPKKWWPRNPKWLGRQPAFFYPGNVRVRDGRLHLTMRKQEVPEMPKDKGYHTYTSAAVQSKTTVKYGYFEIKSRPMNSAGSSAFWFYNRQPDWWTEIDVFEIGANAPGHEKIVHTNVHVFRVPEDKGKQNHRRKPGKWTAPSCLADAYRVHGLEWDEKQIKFYIDGALVRTVENTHWTQPLTLNFDSETMPDWFGLPKDEDLPSTFTIEYVRAWKKE